MRLPDRAFVPIGGQRRDSFCGSRCKRSIDFRACVISSCLNQYLPEKMKAGWYNMRYMASNELDLQMVSAMITTL